MTERRVVVEASRMERCIAWLWCWNHFWMLFHLWQWTLIQKRWDICGIICCLCDCKKGVGANATQSWCRYGINESTIVTEYNGPLEAVRCYTHSLDTMKSEGECKKLTEAGWYHLLTCTIVLICSCGAALERGNSCFASKQEVEYLPTFISCLDPLWNYQTLYTIYKPRRCAYI